MNRGGHRLALALVLPGTAPVGHERQKDEGHREDPNSKINRSHLQEIEKKYLNARKSTFTELFLKENAKFTSSPGECPPPPPPSRKSRGGGEDLTQARVTRALPGH